LWPRWIVVGFFFFFFCTLFPISIFLLRSISPFLTSSYIPMCMQYTRHFHFDFAPSGFFPRLLVLSLMHTLVHFDCSLASLKWSRSQDLHSTIGDQAWSLWDRTEPRHWYEWVFYFCSFPLLSFDFIYIFLFKFFYYQYAASADV
jgi:hypothetical protein